MKLSLRHVAIVSVASLMPICCALAEPNAVAAAGSETAAASPEPAATPAATAAPSVTTPEAAAPADPVVIEVRTRLSNTAAATDEGARKDFETLKAFYDSPTRASLWVKDGKLNADGAALIAELGKARDWGLDPSAFTVPPVHEGEDLSTQTAQTELTLSQAALLYARHARGGRIPEPAEMLNSNLDRKPQLIAPEEVMTALAAAGDKAAYLQSLNPKHPQFELLRQAYLKAGGGNGDKPLSAQAKRLRANMEMWRWMWDDLGQLNVFNNIPEFMQRVYKDGQVIRSEKIVAGMLDKQSSVFSRPLKYVVLRPTWKVPESIEVNELWPSLIRGGGLMRQYGLQMQTKSGQPVDWRKIDWSKEDIRNYEVIQPPGGKSVLGHVKFSFPSQHTIFMHDTPDKWMFRAAQRTLSHGCLRVQKPMELAEIVLAEDKDWDKATIAELDRSGPLNNEVEISKKIPIHLAYFTAWANDDGSVKFFADVYGHEKRVTQALDGQWDRINKGRNHLAPVQPSFNPQAVSRAQPTQRQREATVGDMIGSALGLSN